MVCPLCSESISARETIAELDTVCGNGKKLQENIAKAVKLETMYGPELPYHVLLILAEKFPSNEDVGYLLVKMSDYSPHNIRTYLSSFASARKQVTWAEDFLEQTLTYKNMNFADFFEQYIKNKLPEERKRVWTEKFREMRANYTPDNIENRNKPYLYSVYITSSIINVFLLFFLMIMDLGFFANIAIVVSILFVEVAMIYIHGKKFGDRVQMDSIERLLLVIFMSSLVIAVGGAFIGTFITI